MSTYNSIASFDIDDRRTGRRGPRGRGVGPGWVPVHPLQVRDGFVANYGSHLFVSAFAGLAGIWTAIMMGLSMPELGLFWLANGIAVALVTFLALPAFWYARHRIVANA